MVYGESITGLGMVYLVARRKLCWRGVDGSTQRRADSLPESEWERSSAVTGLFASVFWISFSYSLFKRHVSWIRLTEAGCSDDFSTNKEESR